MTQPLLRTVQCLSPTGLHKMAYKEWGDPHNPKVLICVHGVTRVSDDFDNMARELCHEYRVICPDIVGRGRSDWLRDPQYYQVPQYVSDMVTLLARVNAETVHFFGTSMGGLIGIGLSSLKDNPVRKLILNDVGPVIDQAAVTRITEYLGKVMRFASFDEALNNIKQISSPFGSHTDEEWRKIAIDVLRQDADGQWVRNYDPGIAVPAKAATPESIQQAGAMLWLAYDAIACPTLLVRGAQSDLLTSEVAQAMTTRGPKARLVEIPGVGHAPTFLHADQIAIVKEFLLN